MIHRHLKSFGVSNGPGNLVSWTTSLLVTMRLLFLVRDDMGGDVDTGGLLVVDTALFPRGVFVHDLHLMTTYSGILGKLDDMKIERVMQHPVYLGLNYFGEYLSQGALPIEGKCATAPGEALIDAGVPACRRSTASSRIWIPLSCTVRTCPCV